MVSRTGFEPGTFRIRNRSAGHDCAHSSVGFLMLRSYILFMLIQYFFILCSQVSLVAELRAVRGGGARSRFLQGRREPRVNYSATCNLMICNTTIKDCFKFCEIFLPLLIGVTVVAHGSDASSFRHLEWLPSFRPCHRMCLS